MQIHAISYIYVHTCCCVSVCCSCVAVVLQLCCSCVAVCIHAISNIQTLKTLLHPRHTDIDTDTDTDTDIRADTDADADADTRTEKHTSSTPTNFWNYDIIYGEQRLDAPLSLITYRFLHTYICICVYMCIHLIIYLYMYRYKCVCVWVSVRVCIYVYI